MNKNFTRIALFALFALFVLSSILLNAQGITTAAITGEVVEDNGEPLVGATVVAVHVPSGTQYGTITNSSGRFTLPNMRVGGPYNLKISYIGFQEFIERGIQLNLGQTQQVTAKLREGVELSGVEIIASQDGVLNSEKTGASMNLTSEKINELPTISRNIGDFTRLTPQSNGASFAGRDERFNNYTIDGNIYNNNFGLGSGQFAGSNPISLDAIEEIQVNLAPYDVRQGGFTGANVNAITRSGTNSFTGSAYFYTRNENLIGTQIGNEKLNAADAYTRIYGARLGGPIWKDRLFFFVNVEQEEASNPGLQKLASRTGLEPDGLLVSRVPAERLDFVQTQMRELYDYEAGGYENYGFSNEGLRINARLDFNINKNHKLMLRYNRFTSFRDVEVNGNSLRYNPSALRFRNTNRYGIEAINFRNSHYTVDNNVTSYVAEINSRIGSKSANSLNIGFTRIEDPIRNIPGEQAFPFIEVFEYEGATPLYYMTLGNELFSVGNLLENSVFNITDNFSYFAGKHTITAGFNYEQMEFANAFNPVINGLYRYDSYDDFVASVINKDATVLPSLFLQGYSFEGPDDIPTDDTQFGQLGFYIQDEFQPNPNFRLTAGLRLDLPFYPGELPRNERLEELELNFLNPVAFDSRIIEPKVNALPSVQPLWSPRIGFNWDVIGDASLQVRGGTGLFSGRIPFVWISNQVNNNGVTRGGFGLTPAQWGQNGNPAWQGFQPDVAFYRPNTENLEAQVSQNLAVTDPQFRFPQVWRTNIAVDKKFGPGWVATLEGIYSKDYNSPIAVNLNTNYQNRERVAGPYPFPYWTSGNDYYQDSRFRDIIMLTNTDRGYYASVTAQLQRDFGNGLYASLAYTRSTVRDFGLEGGSQAASLWPFSVVDDRNNPELGFSRFDRPNRFVGVLTYSTAKLVPRFPTTISVFYEGGNQISDDFDGTGRFSYSYSGNFGDGADRLMYIPVSAEDANLIDLEDRDGNVILTAQQQWTILDNYIKQDDYLSDNRGKVAERYGAIQPWLHRFDLKFVQDFVITNNHKLQFTFDILNFSNLLNSEWGVAQTRVQRNLLSFAGVDEENNAQFTINTIPGTSDFPTESYRKIIDLDQTWRGQVGIRYLFK